MTETAITRVQAFIDAHTSRSFRGDQLALTHDGRANPLTLTVTDVKALLQILADYCENDPDTDHTLCDGCDAILCTSCGLGEEEATCQDDSEQRHCTSCWAGCRTCSVEVAEDNRAEAYAEAHGLRY